jgi:hypothetical protein
LINESNFIYLKFKIFDKEFNLNVVEWYVRRFLLSITFEILTCLIIYHLRLPIKHVLLLPQTTPLTAMLTKVHSLILLRSTCNLKRHLIWHRESTWYHMLAAMTGINTIITCHAAWDITATFPKSWTTRYVNAHARFEMLISTALWSVEACNKKVKLKLRHWQTITFNMLIWKIK